MTTRRPSAAAPLTAAPAKPLAVCAPRRSGLTRLQLALLGKGPVARTRPVNCPPWRGSGEVTR